MHELLHAPVRELLGIIVKSVYELRESIHYPHADELQFLNLLERMVVIAIGHDSCPLRMSGLDALEKKVLLLLYSYFLGAGVVLQRNVTKITEAPIFDGKSRESAEVFLALWMDSFQFGSGKQTQVTEEWHMPALELWYDLLSLQKTFLRLWPLIVEMLSLQIVETRPDPEYRHIDQRLRHAKHCHWMHVLLHLERLWCGECPQNPASHCNDGIGEMADARLDVFSQITVLNRKGRYRRLLITLNLCEISGWILIASALNRHCQAKSLPFPPTLQELEQREASVIYVQRVGPTHANDPSILEISVIDRSLPPIDVDIMSINRKLGLDIWFIGTTIGTDYRHIS